MAKQLLFLTNTPQLQYSSDPELVFYLGAAA
jgi:hypothetical protein